MTVTTTERAQIDWRAWRDRWDRQQASYLVGREDRFSLMLDVIARQRGNGRLTILDLCCGTGSISERVLRRFPEARIVAVDADAVLLELGRQGLTDARVTWLQVDLRGDAWVAEALAAAGGPFDAVLTATALHWFWPEELVRLYRHLAGLLAEGGVFQNADHLVIEAAGLRDTSQALMTDLIAANHTRTGVDDWAGWWAALRAESEASPRLAEAFAAHDTFGASRERPPRPELAFHREALHLAGFREVGEIWRHLNDAVLVAVR